MSVSRTLRTDRLILRPFTMADAPEVQRLAGAYEVALNTLLVPHPYPDGAAEEWIASHEEAYAQNAIHHFALEADDALVGAMGLVMKGDGLAEIGYWIGHPYWGRGYATEAGRAVVRYGFIECGLQRIYAAHFFRNPASGRVLRKLGMRHEGTLRRHLVKWGEALDVDFYGILRDEWEAAQG